MKCFPKLAWMCFVGLSACQFGLAQERSDIKKLQQEVSALREQVKALEAKQQQLIAQLSELKKMIQANPPGAQGPSTLSVHGEAFYGNSSARIAMIEYADYQCPFCGKYTRETYPQIIANYVKTGKIRYYYRDLTLPMHPDAIPAARAARCAGEQGKFWEMHDSLYAHQTGLAAKDLVDRAQALGLDAFKFNQCFSSDKYSEDIRKSTSEAQSTGIDGTPTFLFGTVGSNGDVVKVAKRIVGAYPYDDFKSALDELLAVKEK